MVCTVPCDSIPASVLKHIVLSSIADDDKLLYFMVGINFDLSHVNNRYNVFLKAHTLYFFYDLFNYKLESNQISRCLEILQAKDWYIFFFVWKRKHISAVLALHLCHVAKVYVYQTILLQQTSSMLVFDEEHWNQLIGAGKAVPFFSVLKFNLNFRQKKGSTWMYPRII
jgi:hypothetical protein